MTIEDLDEKHIGVDLTKADFQENTTQLCVNDVNEFKVLTVE